MTTSTPAKNGLDHCGHLIFNKAVRSMHMRRNAPPPIPIPINPIRATVHIATPEAKTLSLVAVELSNYPPGLTRRDVLALFQGYMIAMDFVLPTSTRFMFPFRTLIWVTGEVEAKRAARELSGRIIGGRQIRVTLVERPSHEQKEVVVAELADELKIAIINTARVYYPHLTSKILEVREHVEGASHSAFLQARDTVTVDSEPTAHLQPMPNNADWELVAGGRDDGVDAKGQEKSVRLAALKSLQETVEKQGVLKKVWAQCDGSRVLDRCV